MSIILSKTRDEFINGYEKPNSRTQCRTALKVWDDYLKHMMENEQGLFYKFRLWQKSKNENEQLEVYRFLNHMTYEYWPKCGRWESTCKNYFNFVKLWMLDQGIHLEDRILKKKVLFRKGKKTMPIPMDQKIIEQIIENSNPHYRALWLVLASSGMRINECLNLKLSDFNFNVNPVILRIPPELAKNDTERRTAITPEAYEALQKIIKDKKPDDKVFDMNYNAAQVYLERLRKKLGLTQKMANGRFHHIRIHKFRKFTKTSISNSSIDGEDSGEFSGALLGHKGLEQTYYEISDEELSAKYRNAIPSLTIKRI